MRYADARFAHAETQLSKAGSGRRTIGKADYHAKGVLFVPKSAWFATLMDLTEGDNVGRELNEAMKAIEADNPALKDVLPKTYNRLDNKTLIELLRIMHRIPMDIEGDAFGKIYEYFLGEFAKAEGQKGGEFFTPTSLAGRGGRVLARHRGAWPGAPGVAQGGLGASGVLEPAAAHRGGGVPMTTVSAEVLAELEAELDADPTLPAPIKTAILERARAIAVRPMHRAVELSSL